jgi:hypothetical protein
MLKRIFHLNIYGPKHIHFKSFEGSEETLNLERLYKK